MRDLQRPFIIIKRSIHKEVIAIINTYVPNNSASKYVMQRLTKLREEIEN